MGFNIDHVDVEEELQKFTWKKERWTDEKLVACSPFREDERPSFFVDLREGTKYYGCWHDSGAVDPEYSKGDFVKLYAFLCGETYEEAYNYLLNIYGFCESKIQLPRLKLRVNQKDELLNTQLTPPEPCTYLKKRGIGEEVQAMFKTGFERGNNTVVLPWFTANGALGNIKYRRVDCKIFWYEQQGYPIRKMLYGLHLVKNPNALIITEGELDALSFWQIGYPAYPAVALGNSHVSETKIDLIRSIKTEKVYLCVDNDDTGGKVKNMLIKGLAGYKKLYELKLPSVYKDANEALQNGYLKNSLHLTPVKFSFSLPI